MVTKERKWMPVNIVETILKEKATPEEKVEKLEKAVNGLPVRQPRPKPPEGGISQSAASRKYKIPQRTISRWVLSGFIPALLRTNKEVYIDESILAEVAKHYKASPGRGRRTVKQMLSA